MAWGSAPADLQKAAVEGDAAATEQLLLVAGALVDAADEYGCTALLKAAQYGHTAVVRLLLDAHAAANAADMYGGTALHEAAYRGHTAVVQLLLSAQAADSPADEEGWTPLHCAAVECSTAVVQQLLAADADLGAMTACGRTALCVAAQYGHPALVQLLLGAQTAVNAAGEACAAPQSTEMQSHPAASFGLGFGSGFGRLCHTHTHAHVCVCPADPNPYLGSRGGLSGPCIRYAVTAALYLAAQSGHTAVVQLLLDAAAGVDAASAVGTTALHFAARRGHIAVVQLLLNAHAAAGATDGSYFEGAGITTLHTAACWGHTAVVQLMLAVPQLAAEAMAGAAEAVAAAGHTQLALVVLEALMARNFQWPAATTVLSTESVAAEVLVRWQDAEDIIREEEARWLELQQLLVGIAGVHQELLAAAAGVTASATSTPAQAVGHMLDQTAGEVAAAAAAAVKDTAPLAPGTTAPAVAAAAAAAKEIVRAPTPAAPPPAGDQSCAARSAVGALQVINTAGTGVLHTSHGLETTAMAEALSGMHI